MGQKLKTITGVYGRVCICIHVWTCMYICMDVCMYICMDVYGCISKSKVYMEVHEYV